MFIVVVAVVGITRTDNKVWLTTKNILPPKISILFTLFWTTKQLYPFIYFLPLPSSWPHSHIISLLLLFMPNYFRYFCVGVWKVWKPKNEWLSICMDEFCSQSVRPVELCVVGFCDCKKNGNINVVILLKLNLCINVVRYSVVAQTLSTPYFILFYTHISYIFFLLHTLHSTANLMS